MGDQGADHSAIKEWKVDNQEGVQGERTLAMGPERLQSQPSEPSTVSLNLYFQYTWTQKRRLRRHWRRRLRRHRKREIERKRRLGNGGRKKKRRKRWRRCKHQGEKPSSSVLPPVGTLQLQLHMHI